MTFYIQLAKPALLLGDHPWAAETIDYIEANFEQVPPWLEQDLDMLGLLREYAAVRAEFIKVHPLCKQIDDALRDYFLEEQQQGDRAIVAAQVAITEDLDALQAALPLDNNRLHAALYPLWTWVSYDVSERHAAPYEEPSGPRPNWSGRVRELMKQLDSQTNLTAAGSTWKAAAILYRVSQVAVFFAFPIVVTLVVTLLILSVSAAAPGWVFLIAIPICLAGGGYLGVKAGSWIENTPWLNYCQRTTNHLYETLWRPTVLQFQQRSHLDDEEFRDLFANNVWSDLKMSGYISGYAQRDYAPALLSVAQRFLA